MTQKPLAKPKSGKYPPGWTLKAILIVLDADPETSFADIAAVLGISRQAVHDQLKRHAPERLEARARPDQRTGEWSR